jgi:hypothetical protein
MADAPRIVTADCWFTSWLQGGHRMLFAAHEVAVRHRAPNSLSEDRNDLERRRPRAVAELEERRYSTTSIFRLFLCMYSSDILANACTYVTMTLFYMEATNCCLCHLDQFHICLQL